MNGFVLTFLIIIGGSLEILACKDDWVSFGTSCYAFVDEKVTWSTAKEICRTLRAGLIEVNDVQENDFLVGQMKTRHYSRVWTGIQDFLREGRWVTSSDELPATYFNWRHGEPNNNSNNGESGQDCVVVTSNGQWDDDYCDATHKDDVVCEYENEGEVIG